jgi:hypothetical protein
MLSGRGLILIRVRISFDALRLCLLVAAGVTSGYLWRAAFESTSPEDVRVAAKPRIIEPAPVPPIVRISPRHLVRPSRPPAARLVVRRTAAQPARHAPTSSISAPVRSTPKPKPGPAQAPKPTPKPTPTPKPPTQPSTATTQPAQAKPPAVDPTPASAAPPPTVAPPPPTTGSDDDSRPGWGNGDDNHDHDGPGKGNDHGGHGDDHGKKK